MSLACLMSAAVCRSLLVVLQVVLAVDASVPEQAKSFWSDLGVYPAMIAIVAGSIFICCCVLPKLVKMGVFVVILGGGGYLGYKAVKDKLD